LPVGSLPASGAVLAHRPNSMQGEKMQDRPICKTCHKRPVQARGDGRKTVWRTQCYYCRGAFNHEDKKLRKIKKSSCVKCGFIPAHPCQMDVDHRDGNHRNWGPENLEVLCSNCHRLKTHLNRDWYKGPTGNWWSSPEKRPEVLGKIRDKQRKAQEAKLNGLAS
jgi:5-methylcytosine-specific restriction endonuclease McrA